MHLGARIHVVCVLRARRMFRVMSTEVLRKSKLYPVNYTGYICVICVHDISIHISIYVFIYLYLRIYLYMYVYTYICIYTYICVYTYIFMYVPIFVYIYLYLCIYLHRYVYTYIYVYTYAYEFRCIAIACIRHVSQQDICVFA